MCRRIFGPVVIGTVLSFGLAAAEGTSVPADKLIEQQEPGQILAADLLGRTVSHETEGKVGELTSILFDNEDRIVGGVVSVGGFLGIGAKQVALSWDEFDVSQNGDSISIGISRESLEAAPAFRDRESIEAEQERMRMQRQIEESQRNSRTQLLGQQPME